ncbi:protein kinase-like protein [Microterricola gilva]|uniref:Protein kinase-like protein n=1 Tax=Microterricola gilva TaxID=393267 RepID=A0A4Q8AL87_9MICO|nr:protein kinase-like protein [Microterricola gilva]
MRRRGPEPDSEPGVGGASAATRFDDALTDIAGYRVVRRLAVGRSAAVYLGHAAPGGDTVALRVFHAGTAAELIDREIAVLTALPSGVSAPLHDVVSLPDGRLCLVMERDDGPTLAELLSRRSQLRAGEVVTILAPLTVAVAALHAAGLSHGAIGAAAVRFDANGRARLSRWGSARPLGTGAERTKTLRAEYQALGALVHELCAVIDADSVAPHELEDLLGWVDGRVGAHPFLPFAQELERRLFTLSRALAVRMPGEIAAGDPPDRVAASGHGTRGTPPAAPAQAGDEPDRPPSAWRRWGVPEVAGAAAESFGGRGMTALRTALGAALRRHRRPVIVGCTVAAALFVLAITVLPPGGAPQSSAEQSAPVEPAPTDAASTHAAPPGLQGDDPVLAATLLLSLREQCFRESSLLCLDGVDDLGSPIADADAAGIRRAQQSGTAELPAAYDPASIALVERNGGAALLAAEKLGEEANPASLLMVRSEAGWRLREIFDY